MISVATALDFWEYHSCKRGLISKSFFYLKKNVPNLFPASTIHQKKIYWELWFGTFFGNEAKVKNFEIKLPLSKDHKVAPGGLFSGLVWRA